ncbi:hypothetical protein NA56DRAFT_661365 [Hyaloscypha hepaticicola]|uniref:Heterokaryon incompatibility domain-containing protein n=1 Tax=Hyaloscypha hepaticicola TaxID=2082293 RepID=A0A2J6PWL7_9HELO|nr:hypothetical protein NA56DRAFT_661365 [Hyaloscypha hepaticicola]
MTEIYETLIRETQVLDWICLSGGNDSFDPKGKVAASPTLDLAEGKGKSSLQFQKTANHCHFIQSERARGLWPSWVPDHQKPFGGNIPGSKKRGFNNLTKNHEPEIQINGSVLSCHGLIFDTIENPSSSENSEGGFPALAKGLPDDREQLYPPLSSFDAETLDTNACERRWDLLHHQADLLIHGLPLREWVKRRTWNWTFSIQRLADSLGYEGGLEELLAPVNGKVWASAEENPMLLNMIEVKKYPIVEVFSDSTIADLRKDIPTRIVTMDKSVELVPVILRPRKGADGYELIGETYFHGITNGEAFEGSGVEDV